MNSFSHARRTRWRRSRAYAALAADLPPDFVQNKAPEAAAPTDLQPVAWRDDPELEWAPPGHGDLYTALGRPRACSRRCSTRGYRYAFVSNADNLGAVLDPRILAWFARRAAPRSLMEVADRTAADRKGGHLARRRRTAGSSCARSRRRPTRTSTPSRTPRATATSTRTRCGSTCARWRDVLAGATASSTCR